MKRLLLMLIVLSLLLPLFANLVENKPIEYTQPDGTKLSLFLSGDEYYHRVHDEKGFTILRSPKTGFAVYAVQDGKSIQASDYAVGSIDPASLGITPNLMKYDPELESRINEQQNQRTEGTRASSTGNLKNVVCFVRFSDQTEFATSNNYNLYNNMYNSTDQQSLKDYYDEISNSQLNITSYLRPVSAGNVISLQSSHPRGYFEPFDLFNNPGGYLDDASKALREWQLVNELLPSLNNLLDDSINLDGDSDGNVDGLTLIIRGSSGVWGNLLWPHFYPSAINAGTLNGKSVWNWILQFENSINPSVICHETGHLIGAPDLYHYTGDLPWHDIHPAWKWDLMESDNAQYWLTYTKFKYGNWFGSIPEIVPSSTPTTYTLTAADINQYSCYKIQSSLGNQYYMLEYRRKTGRYDVGIPNSGLIVYRVITGLNGNSNGPPDEVYVYRPGGSLTVNGDHDNANFSFQSGRTEIHNNSNPDPWLYVNTSTTLPGNLVITDVGDQGGSTISFTVRNSVPNLWTGAVSTDWNNASNWSLGIPTATQYVEIYGGRPRYPHITSSAICADLKVTFGASLTVDNASIYVSGNMFVTGQLAMTNSSGNLTVQGDLTFGNAGSASVTAYATLYCYKNLVFQAGSTIDLSNGKIQFMGTSNSYLKVYTMTKLYDVWNYKTAGMLNTSSDSNNQLYIKGEFRNNTGSTFVNSSSQSLHILGTLNNYSGAVFQSNVGTIIFDGSSAGYLTDPNSSNYYNSITIAKTGNAHVYISGTTTILGTLALNTGYLNPAGILIVGGNWDDQSYFNQGYEGFVQGTGTVHFNGWGTQTVSGATHFYLMQLNKGGGELVFLNNTQIQCESYDWMAGAYRMEGGWFIANDLADDGIYGTITLNSGNIEYHQDTANWIDVRANLTIHGGNFDIYGGNGPAYLSYVDIATLNMDGGTLDFKNVGIYIPTSPVFNDNITGGTIRTSMGFDNYRTDFNPTGGTIELYGPGSYTITMGTGSNFNDLKINKTASRNDETPYIRVKSSEAIQISDHVTEAPNNRTNEIIAASNLLIDGFFYITAGNFNINGKTVESAYDININGSLTMTSAATLYCDRDFYWNNGSTTNVTTGNIICWGSWYFNYGSDAQLTGSTTQLRADYSGTINSSSHDSWFGNLVLSGGGGGEGCYYSVNTLSVYDSLRVFGTLQINADNELNLGTKNARVTGATTINATGGMIIGTNGYLKMNSSLNLSGYLYINSGYVNVDGVFTNSASSQMFITSTGAGGFFNTVPLYRDGRQNEDTRAIVYLYGAIHLTGGQLKISNNAVTVKAHADRIWSGGALVVGGNFVANEAGAYHADAGTLEIGGSTNSTVDVSGGNYVSSLYIRKGDANTATLANNITIKGTIAIFHGILVANNYNITLDGYFNINGVNSFIPGTGTVTFSGSSASTGIQSSVNFFNLVLNNTNAAWDAFKTTQSLTINVANDLNVQDGTLNINSGCTLSVGRDASIASGAGISAYNGTSCNINVGRNWTDYNTTHTTSVGFNPGLSTLTFNGGTASTLTLSAAYYDVNNLTINKTSGVAVNIPKSIHVLGVCNLTSGNWYDTVTGLTHEFNKDFTIGVSGVWPTTNLNTIAFKGANTQIFTNSGSSYIYNLTVDKSAGIVSLGTNLIGLNGGLVTINAGTLDLNHFYYRTTGNVSINSTGILSIDSDAWLEVANGKTLAVNSGGLLEVIGEASHLARITRQSGLFYCNINSGGSISAEYAVFEYISTGGVYVKLGALVSTVHSFHHCTFRNGGEGLALLVLDNEQTITINDPIFPTNTWGGLYNVRKTRNAGTVNIYNATGGFAGATYEGDVNNRINWFGSVPDLVIFGYSLNNSAPVVGSTIYYSVYVLNNSSADITDRFWVGLYWNAASLPPLGTAPDQYLRVNGLAAGAEASFDFSVSNTNVETWHSWFRVDFDSNIEESDENNNGFGPLTVNWQTLPPVNPPTISYTSFTNTMRLDWTYQYTVSRFKIYRSNSPDSGFAFIGNTTNRYYEEPDSAAKHFYYVTGELLP